ncbi:MAG TPA: hypothetical protein VGO11_24060 [Chthoniobacteraceae bacterium]|jgi:hypothetical protein|nr:hypothetical protein [Chthoniobacteraceae bacterium]
MKKLAIGCGVVLVLLAALIAGLVIAAPKIFKSATGFMQSAIKESMDNARFEAAWQPPTPEPSEQWFPEEVAGWKRASAAPFHEIPELRPPKEDATPGADPAAPADQGPGLAKDGYGAVYQLNGHRIEVKVIVASGLEREGMMARAHGFTPAPENRGGTSSFQSGNRLEMTFGGRERVYVRSLRDWVFFMHTLDNAEIKPFAESWMHAIDQQPPPPAPEASVEEAKPK